MSEGTITITQNTAEGISSTPGGKKNITIGDVVQNTLLFLRDRSTAYRLLFNPKDLKAKLVLKDLLQYSHWGEDKFIEDARLAERLKGRQDVILRILRHQSLTPKQLFTLFNNSPVPQAEQDEED
jgi:hypothetical protein